MEDHIQQAKNLFHKQNLDAALVTNVYDICYLTGFSNFSSEEREAYLFITKGETYLITDGRYTEAVQKAVPFAVVLERSIKKSSHAILSELAKKHKLRKVGFDEHDVSVAEFNQICNCFSVLVPFSLSGLRMKKGAKEIASIQKACSLGDKTFQYLLKQIKEGMTEKELAFLLEMFVKQNGAELSFPSIIAFGTNASVPHHQTGDTKLKKNSFVLLDFGTKVDNYCSDMTRTVFFGEPDEKQRKLYMTVLLAQQKAIAFLNSSKKIVKASDVDKVAREHIIAAGYPSIPHSLGHGTGIEVHEAPSLSPKSKDILSEDMVFSIEPGIYITDFGGVRIEDLFTIHDSKLVPLTRSPRNLLSLKL